MFTQIVSSINVLRNLAGKTNTHRMKYCSVLKESASIVRFLKFIIMIKADHLIIWV